MKITDSTDWRSSVAYDTPVLVADLVPGEPTRCAECGTDSEPLPRTELWAVKHRHPNNHSGYVRFYCSEHVPVFEAPKPVAVAGRAASPARHAAAPAMRPSIADEKPRAMCPDCYVEVSALGLCGICGNTIAV
jgi:hypothetical protein